jgi:SET family sugar efflux transporter-like MFS transporter
MVEKRAVGPRRTVRRLLPLALIFLAVGIASAIVTPFLSLFLSTAVHADPVRLTAYLVAVPVAAVAVSSVVARLSDRRPVRRQILLVAATASLVNAVLFAMVREYWVLLGLAVTVSAVGGTLFPQSFAYAREVMRRDDPDRAAVAISSLRTVFAIAWVAAPPLATLLLGAGGFTAVYGAAAAAYAVAVAVALLLLKDLPKAQPASPGRQPKQGVDAPPSLMWLTAAGFTLLQCVGLVGVQAMALFVTQDLHGAVRDAGLVLGLCAALEIPLMLGFGALSTRVPLSRLILAGTAAGVGYYGLAAIADVSWHLGALQVLNAVFIASWNGLGVAYVQDMMPRHPGRATTMFTNTWPAGFVLAAPILGAAQHFGFRYAYAANVVLCLAGLLLLALGRPRAQRAVPAATPRRAGAPTTSS